MKQCKLIALFGLLLIVFPYSSLAQSIGDDLRQTMKLKQTLSLEELTDGYVAIKIGEESQLGGMSPLIFMGMSAMGQGGNEDMSKFQAYEARWTTGEVTMVGGVRYLVTYKIDFMSMLIKMGGGMAAIAVPSSEAPKVMPKPELTIDLVNLDNVKSLSPMSDMTPDRFRKSFESVDSTVSFVAETPIDDQSSCLSNINQIMLGLFMYAADNKDDVAYVQSTKSMKFVLEPYIKANGFWITNNPKGSEFLFNMALAGANLAGVQDASATVTFYESKPWPDGRRAVAFADGFARFLNEEDWEQAKVSLKIKMNKKGKPLPADFGIGKQ